MEKEEKIHLAHSLAVAFITSESLSAVDIPAVLLHAYKGLDALDTPEEPVVEAIKQEPAVSIRASVKPDYLVCLEDGKRLKMLKRHLATHYNMTPEEYRAKWNLPSDYPMAAPNYSERRRQLAKSIGLGRVGSHHKTK